MHFFLQGIRGIGKSHLLQELLGSYHAMLAGFQVQRLYKDDKLTGFRGLNIADGFQPLDRVDECDLNGVFLHQGRRNVSALEQLIAGVERDSQELTCKLVLLDEIGGMELCSAAFMEPLYRILSSGKPCIGVFKSAQNLAHMAKRQGLDTAYLLQHRQLETYLSTQSTLLTLTAQNLAFCRTVAAAFLAEAITLQ